MFSMKNDKREKIITAMEQLMCIMPDKEISVNMIAEKAGIGKGSVYYYFDSKDEILDAVIERCYKKAIHEFIGSIPQGAAALERIKRLFYCMIKQEFQDNQKNLILSLHLHESVALHNKMKMMAIQEVSPILTELLIEGCAEGTIRTETPKESAEMIVAVITYFLDNTVFPADWESMQKKLKIFATVLDTSLHAAPGSFDFLWNPDMIRRGL